ncbi:SagB/ThcOx family dehydrogenase [Candidatus Kaiserbacteria bacterium]|nr:SagB/ThcOx family dehydrogenase [Candidatus Kaiserbacteria bacterium]
MKSFLYYFFHTETIDRTEKGRALVPKDPRKWPASWTNVVYKHYSLFKPIKLPRAESYLFQKILFRRRSSERYFPGKELTIPILSNILQCGYGLLEDKDDISRAEHRTVPSAGKCYPLEIYLLLFKKIEGCEPGIYHYGILAHTLEPVTTDRLTPKNIAILSPQEWLLEATAMICITSVFDRSVDKYGSRGYRYILFEAGHAAQNMILAGTENGITIVPVGGVEDAEIEKRIGLGTSRERVVYTLCL